MKTPERTSAQLRLPAPDAGVVALSEKYLPKNSRVLDAGTGSGRNALYLAQQGHIVRGVEKDPERLKEPKGWAETLVKTIGRDAVYLHFEEQDIENPVYASETFDAIFVTRVLQELPSIARGMRALKEMQRLTKPNGVNFVTAYIGNQKQRDMMAHLAILKPGDLAYAYEEQGWQIAYTNRVIRPIKWHNGKPILSSYDEIVAHKTSASTTAPQQTDILEYLRRVDPERAGALESMYSA